ncbi:helix-turn-helix domain-containing protein [Clostridium ihumii]|uniref:helix-turn-helix domain-containing protein n=1 Tax=Clostridium ihumii TaxID=1470356 RepID=UPI000687CC14|nr:helix-turn-helix domain-containing protein [Clostridium ihumii]
MGIIRVNKSKDNPYILLNKTALEDANLSFKAKGILAYLMSKPDNWKCSIIDLKKNSKDGRDSLYAGLKELRKHGYLIKRPIKNDKNIIESWEEVIYETPQDEAKKIFQLQEKSKPYTEKPNMGKSISGFSVSGFPTYGKSGNIINTNILNNELINNDTSNSTTNCDLKSIFESNICLLTRNTSQQFNNYLEQYEYAFVKAVVNYCIRCKAKSFAYFKKTIDDSLSKGITKGSDFINNVESYMKEKYSKCDDKNTSKGFKSKQVDSFNNFEQRKYNFEELERDLLGWNDNESISNCVGSDFN